MTPKTEQLLQRMRAGERVALAKLMTLVENREVETAEVMSAIHGQGKATTALDGPRPGPEPEHQKTERRHLGVLRPTGPGS